MSKLLKITPIDEPYMSLTWQVNNFCNFQCSYCNPGNWAGDNRNNNNLNLYKKNIKRIFQQYQDRGYKYFKIFYSGGEPTYWENFIPLTEFLKQELGDNLTVAVNTNLSRPLTYWKQHYRLFDDIVASFHIEFCKQDRYIENAQFLSDKVDYLCTKMLMHEDRFWEVVDFGNRVRNEVPNYNLEWTPLFDEMSVNAGPWKYQDSDKEQFLKQAQFETVVRTTKPYRKNKAISLAHYTDTVEPVNSNKIIAARQNFFKGWKCHVDDSLFINPRGDISSASCGVGNTHGNVLDENLTFDLKPVVCNKVHCHCGTDIIIPKEPYEF
jgi:MoaA/NifB/PqqE/SkfB family radical SAM enzyme